MDNISLFFRLFNLNGYSLVLDKLMVIGAVYLLYLIFLLVFILGIKGGIREKKSFLLLILGIPIAILLIKVIHLFFIEPRPFVTFPIHPLVTESPGAAFPSRHATIAAVIAFSFTYFKSKWAFVLLPCLLWVGISRIFVGVHYPLDILGGLLVGIISLLIALPMKQLLRNLFMKSL